MPSCNPNRPTFQRLATDPRPDRKDNAVTLTPIATPFGYAAPTYRENGLAATIPIPPRSKRLNLRGFTGDEGRMPTDAEVADWLQTKADHNIAWRLPHGLLGLIAERLELWSELTALRLHEPVFAHLGDGFAPSKTGGRQAREGEVLDDLEPALIIVAAGGLILPKPATSTVQGRRIVDRLRWLA